METTTNKRVRYQIRWPRLPLAVYREIAAHLRQIEGVETGLTAPDPSLSFDYTLSQVGALWIEYGEGQESRSLERIEQILAYYRQRFGDFVLEIQDN